MPHSPITRHEKADLWLMPVFIAKEGHEAHLQEALHSLQRQSRKDHGCLEYTVFVDGQRPGAFVLFEAWASREDLEAHNGEVHVREFMKESEQLLAVPFSVTPLAPLP